MILNVIIYIILILLDILTFLSYPKDVWPDTVYEAIDYGFNSIGFIDIWMPAATVFAAVIFLLDFIAVMIGILLVKKFINWIRGSGEI